MNLSPYTSSRLRAWRNAMVAAINAGLANGHFGLAPGDNRWPNAAAERESGGANQGQVFHFTFPGSIPAVAWVGDAGFDELSFHVLLWPFPEGEERVKAA